MLLVVLAVTFVPAAMADKGVDEGHVALVEATLESMKPISMPPPSRVPDEINFFGPFRHKFKVSKILVGQIAQHRLLLDFNRSGFFAPGGKYFLLVRQTETGPVVAWWGYVNNGLCVDRDIATKYGMFDAVRRLQGRYPCTYSGSHFVR
jgi:hypothetical protein